MSLKLEQNPLEYDMPWRPNFEKKAALAWLGAAGTAMTMQQLAAMPPQPFYWMTGICAAMAMSRIPAAIRLHRLQKNLGGYELQFTTLTELRKIMEEVGPAQLWLGHGFAWEQRHAQRVFEILKRDWDGFGRKPLKKGELAPMGQAWIHGIEPHEAPLPVPMSHFEGHSLIAGTTGSGKTRLFDLFISQCILRGEAVFIFDPKGDKEMRDNARRACEAMGAPEKFVQFHTAFPEESVRINPLHNFTRPTELASRIMALVGEMDSFGAFSWQAVNDLVNGLLICDERPTLKSLRSFLDAGPARLVSRAVQAYAEKVMPDWQEKARDFLASVEGATAQKHANIMYSMYYDVIEPEHASTELEGLLASFKHDPSHFVKMIAGLKPIMNMLTSGILGELLSPDLENLDDKRPATDTATIINQGQVVYFGLDSLSDSIVSTALGSMFLADLTSVAGDRYNYVNPDDLRPVNIFIDEAAEIINDPFIQLLNKGRGAKYRMFVATQTISDFSARLGSEDKANQVLGNINNIISLRITDPGTQQFMADNLPPTRVKYVMRTQGQNTHSDQPLLHGGNQGERLMEEEAELFPQQLFGMLPNLEYLAKVSGGRLIKGRLPILIPDKNMEAA